MMKLRINDIVQVSWSPRTDPIRFRKLTGVVGYIHQFNPEGTRALVQRFNLEGRLVREKAWVPLLCLELVTDPAWKDAFVELHLWLGQIRREGIERHERWRRNLETVATKYHLSFETALQIAHEANQGAS